MSNNEQQPNDILQPDLHKANVGSSSFLDVVKEMDKYALQTWVDKTLWRLSGGKTNYSLMVRLKDDHATVEAQGWGSCQPLIAKTPDELRECINCWWRNR